MTVFRPRWHPRRALSAVFGVTTGVSQAIGIAVETDTAFAITANKDYPVGIADDYVRCPDLHDANAFAVRVVGDSMEPRFHEGDIVIFSLFSK